MLGVYVCVYVRASHVSFDFVGVVQASSCLWTPCAGCALEGVRALGPTRSSQFPFSVLVLRLSPPLL